MVGKAVFESHRAIAVAARPRLVAVLIATFGARVRVLDFHEVEELLPIGPFFFEWRTAVADFDPARGSIVEEAGVPHVAQVFTFRDGASSECSALNGLEQLSLFSDL
jgi:hypothetical protein